MITHTISFSSRDDRCGWGWVGPGGEYRFGTAANEVAAELAAVRSLLREAPEATDIQVGTLGFKRRVANDANGGLYAELRERRRAGELRLHRPRDTPQRRAATAWARTAVHSPRPSRKRRRVVAIDGSCAPGSRAWCWYETAGRWAAGPVHPKHPDGSCATEFAACIAALRATDPTEPVTLITDLQQHAEQVAKIQAGETISGGTATTRMLRRIRDLIRDRDVIVRWERGHNGHGLNEAADRRARALALTLGLDRTSGSLRCA